MAGLFVGGNSRDWKTIIISAFERGWGSDVRGHAVALIESGKTMDLDLRLMVQDVGHKLGIGAVVWTN